MKKQQLLIILESCLLKQDFENDEEVFNICADYPKNLVKTGIKLHSFLQEKLK